jgi:hypothetical protein
MIDLITGKIGGGKSLLALTRILARLEKGHCCVSNIALIQDEVAKYLRDQRRYKLKVGQLRQYDFEKNPTFQDSIPWGVPDAPVYVVCDEAHLYYNAALASSLTHQCMKLVSFLTQSRKASVDVTYITQDDRTLWTQFRNQAHFGYKCRDMRQIDLPFIGKAGFLGLNWVRFDIISGEIMERGRTPLNKKLFKLYDTYQMYDEQMTTLQQNAEIWNPNEQKEIYQPTQNHENNSDSNRSPFLTWLLRH